MTWEAPDGFVSLIAGLLGGGTLGPLVTLWLGRRKDPIPRETAVVANMVAANQTLDRTIARLDKQLATVTARTETLTETVESQDRRIESQGKRIAVLEDEQVEDRAYIFLAHPLIEKHVPPPWPAPPRWYSDGRKA